MPYTEEELAGLTDAEREALEGDDEDTSTDDEDEADEQDQDAGDDASAEDDAEADAGDDDGDEGAEPEPVRAEQQGPILVADAPEHAEERLKEIAGEKAGLRKQYDDGELTFEEYESRKEQLDDERTEIRLAVKEAETAWKIEQQRQINERDKSITSFLNEVGIPRDPNDAQYDALDRAVRVVAALPESADKSAREILQEAYELAVFRKQITPKTAQQEAPKKVVKPRETVPTLARIPAADQTAADDGNRFAHIDRISDPVARERAFARLSPADQDAYLGA